MYKRDFSLPAYSLDTSLKTVKCVKNLGIKVSSDLYWSEHVTVTVNKANKLLGLARQIPVRSPLYKSLVRRVLEYAAPVWSPCLSKGVLAKKFSKEPLGSLSGKNVGRWKTKIV